MHALSSPDICLFGEFRLDRRRAVLFRRDEGDIFAPVVMSSCALGILELLVERSGELVTRTEIMPLSDRGWRSKTAISTCRSRHFASCSTRGEQKGAASRPFAGTAIALLRR